MGTRQDQTLPVIHDVIIVGAGPCGLAVAARLRERTPSALFTDEEHHRYHWINKHTNHAAIKNSRTGAVRCGSIGAPDKVHDDAPTMLVLDSSGSTWMNKWKRLFHELEITHLRSPMFFHPDPQERDGLLAYVHAVGRECDCQEIVGCVGKELSKHQIKKRRKFRKAGNEHARPPVTIDERERKDYFTPPSDLFVDYCDWIANRYGLCGAELIRHDTVTDIDFDVIPHLSPLEDIFTIRTEQTTYYARSVVLAVGPGNAPSVPSPFPQTGCLRASHAFLGRDQDLITRLAAGTPTNVLVLGGGLTSAQIADRTLRKGGPRTRVWHLMRSNFKVKPFDIDLSWMGKFRNHEKASFWSADTDSERCDLINSARGGGSITPRYAKIMHQHIANERLCLHTNTVVTGQRFCREKQTWTIQTEPPIDDLPEFDFIYFATGVQSDFEALPYLQKIVHKHPIKSYAGLPALTDDLMWSADVPLFVTGKFAGLRLGPGAGNLEGARTGAERIAWAMPDVLGEPDEPLGQTVAEDHNSDLRTDSDAYRYTIGAGSRFQALTVEG